MPRGQYPRYKLRGSNHYAARLDSDKVRLIRKSTETAWALAKQLKVNPWTINDVRSGKTWAHVE